MVTRLRQTASSDVYSGILHWYCWYWGSPTCMQLLLYLTLSMAFRHSFDTLASLYWGRFAVPGGPHGQDLPWPYTGTLFMALCGLWETLSQLLPLQVWAPMQIHSCLLNSFLSAWPMLWSFWFHRQESTPVHWACQLQGHVPISLRAQLNPFPLGFEGRGSHPITPSQWGYSQHYNNSLQGILFMNLPFVSSSWTFYNSNVGKGFRSHMSCSWPSSLAFFFFVWLTTLSVTFFCWESLTLLKNPFHQQ